jgi:hypothetical protein
VDATPAAVGSVLRPLVRPCPRARRRVRFCRAPTGREVSAHESNGSAGVVMDRRAAAPSHCPAGVRGGRRAHPGSGSFHGGRDRPGLDRGWELRRGPCGPPSRPPRDSPDAAPPSRCRSQSHPAAHPVEGASSVGDESAASSRTNAWSEAASRPPPPRQAGPRPGRKPSSRSRRCPRPGCAGWETPAHRRPRAADTPHRAPKDRLRCCMGRSGRRGLVRHDVGRPS